MKDIKWYKHPVSWSLAIIFGLALAIGLYARKFNTQYEPWQPYETTINLSKSSVENGTWKDSLHIIQTDSAGNIIKEFILYYR